MPLWQPQNVKKGQYDHLLASEMVSVGLEGTRELGVLVGVRRVYSREAEVSYL